MFQKYQFVILNPDSTDGRLTCGRKANRDEGSSSY